jgi:hypothetical protein
LLKRIAEAMEIQVLREYGVRIGHCAEAIPDPHPNLKPETTYATDEMALRAELIAIAKGRKPGNIIDDEEEFGI